MEQVRLGANTFAIKPLDSTLIACSRVPISFFTVKKPQTMYEQMRKAPGKEETDKQLEVFQFVLGNGVESLNSDPFDCDAYLSTSSDIIEAMAIVYKILSITFKRFKIVSEMDISDVLVFYKLAMASNKTPIEVLFPTSEYSDWDAYIFNSFIFINAHNYEAEQQKTNYEMQKRELKRAR